MKRNDERTIQHDRRGSHGHPWRFRSDLLTRYDRRPRMGEAVFKERVMVTARFSDGRCPRRGYGSAHAVVREGPLLQ